MGPKLSKWVPLSAWQSDNERMVFAPGSEWSEQTRPLHQAERDAERESLGNSLINILCTRGYQEHRRAQRMGSGAVPAP